MICFIVPGTPVAQPRARSRVAGGKTRKPFVQIYYPSDDPIHAYKDAIRVAAMNEWLDDLITAPVLLGTVFVFPITSTVRRKTNPRRWKSTKPDLDNLEKAVQDALSGTILADDRQIVSRLYSMKRVAEDNEEPHTLVEIKLAGELP
jgi:Holliday junction resolvase RusA-like endonuclease